MFRAVASSRCAASALALAVRATDSPAIAAWRAVGPAGSGYHTRHLEGLQKKFLSKQSAPVSESGFPDGRVPQRGVGAVGNWLGVATAESPA